MGTQSLALSPSRSLAHSLTHYLTLRAGALSLLCVCKAVQLRRDLRCPVTRLGTGHSNKWHFHGHEHTCTHVEPTHATLQNCSAQAALFWRFFAAAPLRCVERQLRVPQSCCGAGKQLKRLHCLFSLMLLSGPLAAEDMRWLSGPRAVIVGSNSLGNCDHVL